MKSGIVLGICTFFYLLFELSGYTTISIIANTLLLGVIGSFVYATVTQLLGKSAMVLPEPNPEAVDKFFTTFADKGKTITNNALGSAYRLAQGHEPALSIKTGFVLYMIAKVGALMNFMTLTYLIVLSVFTLPKVYDMYKEEIDKVVNMAVSKCKDVGAQGKKILDEKVLSKIQLPSKKTE